MNSTRSYATDKAWNWVRPVPGILDYLVMEPRGGDTFEVVVKDGYPPKVCFHAFSGLNYFIYDVENRLRVTGPMGPLPPKTSSFAILRIRTGISTSAG